MAETQEFIATGRRKTAVARIRMTPGNGKIDINGKSFEDYFPTVPLQNTVLQPLQVVKLTNAYDISVNTTGGGATGQAGAARLAISRALLAGGRKSARHFEGRGIAQARSADEGTEEVRPAGRAQALPVLEAIIPPRHPERSRAGLRAANERYAFCEAGNRCAAGSAKNCARNDVYDFGEAARRGCGGLRWAGHRDGRLRRRRHCYRCGCRFRQRNQLPHRLVRHDAVAIL